MLVVCRVVDCLTLCCLRDELTLLVELVGVLFYLVSFAGVGACYLVALHFVV